MSDSPATERSSDPPMPAPPAQTNPIGARRDQSAPHRRALLRGLAATGAGWLAGRLAIDPASAQALADFSSQEILDRGHSFFGDVARGLAQVVEEAGRRWGEPNGYVLGQEASGALVGGLRYGEGALYTRNAGDRAVFWQGTSIGFDAGAEGARTMMLLYNLPDIDAIYARFAGLDGSAYLVGGLGFTALAAGRIIAVPIRAGLGARLGVNVGYLKFTPEKTWNPF